MTQSQCARERAHKSNTRAYDNYLDKLSCFWVKQLVIVIDGCVLDVYRGSVSRLSVQFRIYP